MKNPIDRLSFCSWLLVLTACGGAMPAANEGPDGGASASDAGAVDGGAPLDAGVGDGGEQSDAGSDAGTEADAGSDGGRLVDAPLPTGAVGLLDGGACPTSTDAPRTRCLRLEVACPREDGGAFRLAADVKVSDPPGGTTLRGTVLLGTGSGGTSFYESNYPGAAPGLIRPLRELGFRVVQRRWMGPGWLSASDQGQARHACLYATLAAYLASPDAGVHAPGTPFCATGNSGGSSEIAYALARYGAGSYLDFAVMSGGPPHGRIDYGCGAEPRWNPQDLCDYPTHRSSASGVCTYGANVRALFDEARGFDAGSGPCQLTPDGGTGLAYWGEKWREESAGSASATFAYPATPVRFLHGDLDDTEAVPIGAAFFELVETDKARIVLAGVGHPVPSFDAGREKIFEQLVDGGCVLRH